MENDELVWQLRNELIRQLENEYIKLHSQIMNSFNPTEEQWARLDGTGKEIVFMHKERERWKRSFEDDAKVP